MARTEHVETRTTMTTAVLTAAVVALSLSGACRATQGKPAARPDRRTSLASADAPRLIYRCPPPASAQNPALSPDGQSVLFTLFHAGYNDGPAGLYRVPANGGRATKVLDEPGQDNVNVPGSCWNATTRRIAFASDRRDIDEVWTADPDGAGLRRVTRHTGARYFIEPSFSPDGRWIVFEVDVGATEPRQTGSIWKVGADGNGVTRLSPAGARHDDRLPNWSPKGDRIVFQRRRVGTDVWNIYTMAPDGSGLRRVTNLDAGDTDPSFSPDGRFICYSSDYGGLPVPNIWVVRAGGGTPLRVTRNSRCEHGAPSWSPDGQWIAFESHSGQSEDTPASLWRVRAPVLK